MTGTSAHAHRAQSKASGRLEEEADKTSKKLPTAKESTIGSGRGDALAIADEPSIRRVCRDSNGGLGKSDSPPAEKASSQFADLASADRNLTKFGMSVKTPKEQVINDSIHGHIRIPPVAMAIIDTPQFQRLRSIKQLGTCHWVYPAATHTRFQHSLGVGFLAQKFALELQKQERGLVDDKDVTCVLLAGLCHDLGHGPFSHLWEGFVAEAKPDADWHHEDSSIQMLDYLLEDNRLRPVLLEDYGIDETDILFVKELIAGPIDEASGLPVRGFDPSAATGEWQYRGRGEDKSFLFEIVANKISGIDVDKWDYFLRDNTNLQIGMTFNYERFIMFSRVLKTGNPPRRHICIRDKEESTLRSMFEDRARLHKDGYQHRVTKLLDRMLIDAWLLADRHVMTRGGDGRLYSLSDSWRNVVALSKLTDCIFERVLHSDCVEAVEILNRIQKRDLYRVVATLPSSMSRPLMKKSNAEICSEIRACATERCLLLNPEDVFVVRRKVTSGMGNRNPIRQVTFYRMSRNEATVVDPVGSDDGDVLDGDHTVWVCCRRNEELPLREAAKAVRLWSSDRKIAFDE